MWPAVAPWNVRKLPMNVYRDMCDYLDDMNKSGGASG